MLGNNKGGHYDNLLSQGMQISDIRLLQFIYYNSVRPVKYDPVEALLLPQTAVCCLNQCGHLQQILCYVQLFCLVFCVFVVECLAFYFSVHVYRCWDQQRSCSLWTSKWSLKCSEFPRIFQSSPIGAVTTKEGAHTRPFP